MLGVDYIFNSAPAFFTFMRSHLVRCKSIREGEDQGIFCLKHLEDSRIAMSCNINNSSDPNKKTTCDSVCSGDCENIFIVYYYVFVDSDRCYTSRETDELFHLRIPKPTPTPTVIAPGTLSCEISKGRSGTDKKHCPDAGALASSKETWKYYYPDCKKSNVDNFYIKWTKPREYNNTLSLSCRQRCRLNTQDEWEYSKINGKVREASKFKPSSCCFLEKV